MTLFDPYVSGEGVKLGRMVVKRYFFRLKEKRYLKKVSTKRKFREEERETLTDTE